MEYSREDGSKTRVQYMHLSEIAVKKGDVVNARQKLGVTGNTGTRTTGEHCNVLTSHEDLEELTGNPVWRYTPCRVEAI